MWIALVWVAWAAPGPVAMRVEESTSPEGVTVSWTGVGCALSVRVDNGTPEPVAVDWTRSTFTPMGLASVGIVPGSQSAQSAMLGMPVSMVPPGGFIEEPVFRRDRLPSDKGDSCAASVGESATVMLSVGDGWATTRMVFAVDAEALAVARRQVCDARIADLKASIKRRDTLSWWIGGPLVGLGSFLVIGSTVDAAQGKEDAAAGIAGGVTLLGTAAAVVIPVRIPIPKWREEIAVGCER